MRVIVTGASGYIGGETALRLVDQGHIVLGIDDRELPAHLAGSYEFKQEDFSSDRALAVFCNFDPDCVIHCAGTSLVGPSILNPQLYYHNNFVKTKRLLDHLLGTRVRVVFSSSAAVYGDPVMAPCNEVDPIIPISPYGESKAMIEWMMAGYARAYNLDYVAFRYFNACGADANNRHGQEPGATHIIARVLESLLHGTEFQLYGDNYPTADGTCVRDYVHVQDLANAHILAALLDNQVPSGVYNLGTGRGISNRQIIEAAQRITGRQLNMTVKPIRTGDPAVLTADAGKFAKVSGWQPQFDLDTIIQHAWAWYQKQS
jgi:UDP-glucose 4-epimerase